MEGILLLLALASPQSFAAPDCSKPAGTVPNPYLPVGFPDPDNPIEHVIVIMQENHSFDSYFGKLNDPKYYGPDVDGVDDTMWNPDPQGKPVYAFHQSSYCVEDPIHDWTPQHDNWDGGKNDRFVINNSGPGLDGGRVMGYYTDQDLNFYYALANNFAVADRYFCSVIGPTLPNRYFLMAGTAFGHANNDFFSLTIRKQKTIFDVLEENGVSWKYYYSDWAYLSLFETFWKNLDNTALAAFFKWDLDHDNLPAVSFVESSVLGSDEHPPGNVQSGQKSVAGHVRDLIKSPYWKNSVLFLTYDENGGYFDHVAPPEACAPDNIPPDDPGPTGAGYDHFGFRVPFVAISPYAKHHYVSHHNYDHTSILGFIESKFNLPALTVRDANTDPLMDLFDFSNPQTGRPNLPKPATDAKQFWRCLLPPGIRGL
jgi:phospholipase C